uniref:tRNA (guanine(37)-N1)-methyltransferase n=1 Tax=Phallusia mammillata TaxID=59560 RepID=A0A6F9DW69_9ASCI|nr:tRNA (guanine(37)-N1)-methyltransferase [Phallusia mammillata]
MLIRRHSFLSKVRKFFFKMDEEVYSLRPPLAVRGMTVLDREAFKKTVFVKAAVVPKNKLQPFLKQFKKRRLQRFNLKAAVGVESNVTEKLGLKDHGLVLLEPGTTLSKDERDQFNVHGDLIEHKINLSYENFKPSEVFGAVFPCDLPNLSAFTQIGHIVHVNLKEQYIPYKTLIAQVLLDKLTFAKTVIHKHNTIDNEFRTFEFELLGGVPEYVTKVIEYQIAYEFDFSKVFWNSRLSTEHRRLAEMISNDCIVFDVFAGVGPFAIPLAKKGCTVYANDLNPESFKWLEHNAKLNKTKLNCFNMDGRDFLKQELKKFFLLLSGNETEVHVVMNLPEIAIEFLDVFNNLLQPTSSSDSDTDPTSHIIDTDALENCALHVHCYTFTPLTDAKDLIATRFENHFGQPMPKNCSVHQVRSVAPYKRMFCISFLANKDILLFDHTASMEPDKKRIKL